MRLFVAVWPDQATLDLLGELPRPSRPGVRWTRPEQWHVTLRFFGEADPSLATSRLAPALGAPIPGVPVTGAPQSRDTVPGAPQSRDTVPGAPPAGAHAPGPGEQTEAVLGPATALLGRGVLCVAVAGLEPLARLVEAASADIGQPPRPGPFRGHLTLARGLHPSDLRPLAGHPVSSRWTVAEVVLVASVTGRAGSRYTILERWPLGPDRAVPPPAIETPKPH